MAGLSSMALGDAYVNILAETSSLQGGLLRAQAMVSSFVGIAGAGLSKGLVGAMIGVPMVVGGAMVYSVKKFMEAEVVSKRLAGAIAMAGGSVDLLMPKYDKLADKISRITKWDDEEVKSAMASALARGLSTKKMEEAIPAATGLAARMGIDLGSAMNMVTRAGLGNVMMLQRYFPQLKQATTATEKWAMVLKIGAAGMPMARGEINTISGAFGQMRKAVGEVFESFGEGLVKSGKFKDALQGITNKIWGMKDATDKLVSEGKFQAWVDENVLGLRYMGEALGYYGSMFKVLFFDPIVRITGYIINRLAEIANVGFEFGNLLIRGLIDSFMYVGTALGSLENAIKTSLYEPFKWVVTNIGTMFSNLFDNIKSILTSLWNFNINKNWADQFPKLKSISLGTTETDTMFNNMRAGWQTFVGDVSNTTPFDATMDQLKTLRASLQTLGQGFATNPFIGWIDSIEKVVTDLWAADKALDAPPAWHRNKPGEKVVKPPSNDVTGKATFSIISMADQWKKLQEGISKDKDAACTAKNTGNTATTIKEFKDVFVTWSHGGQAVQSPLFAG